MKVRMVCAHRNRFHKARYMEENELIWLGCERVEQVEDRRD